MGKVALSMAQVEMPEEDLETELLRMQLEHAQAALAIAEVRVGVLEGEVRMHRQIEAMASELKRSLDYRAGPE